MSKKVLMIAGDAVEALEIYYPYFRCLEEGYDITIAASSAKKLQTVVHDFVGWETYSEKEGYMIEADAAFADVNPEEYDGLIIPGGRSPEHIRLNEHVPKIVSHFFEANKPVAAVCHASLVLTTVREHIKGREMTGYIACKPEIEAAGATYIEKPLHTEGNLVSGHAWPDMPGLMKEFFKQLEG
ncbi:MAG TPA: DJ-1/PfpI family protein [Bacillota bacterium]|nr:DJ-1/PfpI family protein [Bacillota bacterium]